MENNYSDIDKYDIGTGIILIFLAVAMIYINC